MILTCNECGIGFNFDETLLQETGSKVRCSKCKNVFTAYPPSSSSQPEKTDFALEDERPVAPSSEISNDDGVELKNIDLAEIEGILSMDNEPDAVGASTKGSGEIEFDFTTKEDEGEANLESTLESEQTEELDLSEMDNILKEDEGPEETLALDLSDMENILEAEDETAEESESPPEEDPGFELGLDFDSGEDEGKASPEAALESEQTEELDLSEMENILKEDKEPAIEGFSTDESLGLDFEIDESSDEEGSGFEPDETVSLNLSDMENILEVEDEPSEEADSSQEENFDFELDFGSDTEDVSGDSEPDVESETKEDLDLSDFENILEEGEEPEDKSLSAEEDGTLNLDFDIDEGSDEDGSDFELEETVELDLSEMDNVLGIEDEESEKTESAAEEDLDFELDLDFEDEKEQDDKTPKSDVEEAEVSDELDFELDLDMDEDESPASAGSELEPEIELEDIEELDLSDMDDGPRVKDNQGAEEPYDEKTDELDFELDLVQEEGEDPDNDSLAVELGDAEEFDLSDLDSVLDEENAQAGRDDPTEEIEELELDLDIEDDIVDTSNEKIPELEFASTEKFDLSDINSMIDTDEKIITQDVEPEEVELDFEIEENAQDLLTNDETIEELTVSHKEDKLDDTFDMGAIEFESDAEDVESFTDSKKGKTDAHKKKPSGKKKLSRPMRILLVLVLLFGGAYGAHEVLNSMGIKISVTDAVREIPFVGDLLKPDVKDVGNLYMDIFEKTVDGKFVDNPKIGTLFVVTGQIKNEYKHSRRFITMTGKIFKKGKALVKTETVYCGNLLSETELKNLNNVAIIKRLKNRLGDKRINMNVKKGQILPFMIVFQNVPSGLEEYSVQVAGSEKS
jgi:pilus assembly protein FimV